MSDNRGGTALAASAASVDLGLIHRLTDLNAINRILHEMVAKERAIDVELDQLLSKRSELEKRFLLLNAPTAEVRHRRSVLLDD
jgi:hypothetical protein